MVKEKRDEGEKEARTGGRSRRGNAEGGASEWELPLYPVPSHGHFMEEQFSPLIPKRFNASTPTQDHLYRSDVLTYLYRSVACGMQRFDTGEAAADAAYP